MHIRKRVFDGTLALSVMGLNLFWMGQAGAASFSFSGSLAAGRVHHTATLLSDGKVLVAGGVAASGVTNGAELYDPASGSSAATNSLSVGRFNHTATCLTNGKVLIVGGHASNSSATNSVEVFDPATGTWAATGSLNVPRQGHTATLLPNGKILVAGGGTSSGIPTNSAELYDPATGLWTATGTLTYKTMNHTATLLPNGLVLVAGGTNSTGPLTNAAIYNPGTGTWTVTGSFQFARFFHTATLMPNGKVLLVGGETVSGYLVSGTELYDPNTGTWSVTGAMAASREFHTTTLLPNGKVLAAGGLSQSTDPSVAELYDPNTGTWTTNGTFRTPRAAHTATLLPSGSVLITGGTNVSGFTNQTEVYVVANGAFTSSGPLITARYHHTGTLLPNGKALITGGYNGGFLASEELYDPATGTNSITGPMNSARIDHTATLLPSGKVLIAGGTNGAVLSSVELYDPATGTNTTIAPMTIGRYHHTATLMGNGKVLVAGGVGAGGSVSNAEVFDPALGTWTVTGSMGGARNYHTATLLTNGKVLAVGGFDGSTYLATAELYDPATGQWSSAGSVFQGRSEHTATLLPSGKVLVAGGFGGVSTDLAGTVLYDPVAGTWASAASLVAGRYGHTATLLLNGKVVVAGGVGGGFGGGALDSVEIYDPTTRFWTYLSGAISPRYFHAAVVFPNGKALIIGGAVGSSPFQGEALYDAGLGFSAAWQPRISSMSSTLVLSNSVALSGTGFRGISEAAGGNGQSGPGDYPLVQVRSIENEQTSFLLMTNWTTNSFISKPVLGFPQGYALATVFVNGIPGTSSVVNITTSRDFGMDVSHFQGETGISQSTWNQMFAEGKRFVFIKATEGWTVLDGAMPNNITRATAAGLRAGVYHFAHPELHPTTGGAVQEADYLLSNSGNFVGPGYLRPVLDLEAGSGLGATALTDWVVAFANEIIANRGAAAAPIIYTLQSFANTGLDSRLAAYDLWLRTVGSGANPATDDPPGQSFSDATGVFNNWSFWQYSESGSSGGVSPLDLNVCHSEFKSLDSFMITPMTSPVAPTIVSQPQNRTVQQGQGATFSVGVSVGSSPPLFYQWSFAGTNIGGATTTAYTRTNAQLADGGSYTVVVTNAGGSVTSAVATLSVVVPPPPVPSVVVYQENFDSYASPSVVTTTGTTNGFKMFFGAASGPIDFNAKFGFDYSTVSSPTTIPSAPHSSGGTTRGLYLTVNKDGTQAAAAVNLYPVSQTFSGTFALKFDVWINYPNTGTATEDALFGINHSANITNRVGQLTSDGLLFAVDGDGGVTSGSAALRDFAVFVGGGAGAAPVLLTTNNTVFGPAPLLGSQFDNADAGIAGLFPSKTLSSFTTIPGTPGNGWVSVEVRQATNLITWLLNDITIAQYTNLYAFTNGDILIGYNDNFPSIGGADNFVVFDNIRVEVPDLDTNGLADAWEMQFFGHTGVDPNADADGDGMSNLREFLSGTNPTNAASSFRALNAAKISNDIRLDWTTVAGHSYVVQFAPSSTGSIGTNFADLSPVIWIGGAGEGTTNYVQTGGATNQGGYYRVRLGH